jgi:hypothetical protein
MKYKHIILFAALALITTASSAQIQFTAGINYESGVPSGAPSSTGSRLRVDLASGRIYQWSAANTTWRTLGQGIDIVAGCAAPAYTPGYAQSVFAVNGCNTPELYYYTGTQWKQVAGGGGGGATYYAGTGIDIDANDTISIDTVPRLIFYSDKTYSGGVGAMRWNSDDGTLDLGLKGGNVTLQLGQELVQPVKHATNGGLDNGKVVYITGSSGDNKKVLYARANSEATSANTLGLMTETVTGGNKGFCTTFGLVRNINTSNLTEGGAVWLSKDTAGAMTAVRPEAPNHGVFIGFCVRKHASTGVIFVNVQNGYELNELHNVHVPSPSNNQALVYKSGNSRWEAMTIDTSSTNEGKLQGFKPSNNLYYDINTNTSGGTPITLYRGTGIGFDGTGGSPDGGSLTINNTGDLSEFNEGTLGVGAGSSTTAVISSNTSGANGVTIAAGNGMSISETTSSNGGTITVTALDSLATNEGTLGVGAGSSTTAVINSNTSGASGVTITAGGGISVSETTSSNGGNITLTATDGSVTNEGKLSTRLNTGADVWIRSNTSTSDDIGIVAGTGVTISGINSSSGGQIVVSSPAQTIDTFSVSGSTLSLSLSGDSQPAKTVTLPGGGGGGTPAGNTGEVQFNNSGFFGASSNLFWNAANNIFNIGGSSLDPDRLNITASSTIENLVDLANVATTATLSAGWSGSSFATGYTHSSGTTTLVANTSTVIGLNYKINYTIQNRTSGSITINIGGYTSPTITSSGSYTTGGVVINTNALTVTPTNDFNGTVILSLTPIGLKPLIIFRKSNLSNVYEFRVSQNASNFLLGQYAGAGITTGSNNYIIGNSSGVSITTGTNNITVGNNSLQRISNQSFNTGIGNFSLQSSTGTNNIGIGYQAAYTSSSGSNFVAIGSSSSYWNNGGSGFISIGKDAAQQNVAGNNYIAIGISAAQSAVGGGNSFYFGNGVYIGSNVLATSGTSGSYTTNETVIGNSASGLGNNSTVIGNASTTRTHFFGNTTIGGTTAAAFTPLARLHVLASGALSGADAFIVQNSTPSTLFDIENNGKITYWATNTAAGTTAVQTINRPSGTINIAAGESSKVVNNSLCTTSSIVLPVMRTNDATALIDSVVPGNGSFTIYLTAAAAAETSVGFFIIN